VLSERVSQLDNDVGKLVTPPVLWRTELTKQFEMELENIQATCREACEAAESLGKAFSSDVDMLVKTSIENRQDATILKVQTEKLQAKVEQVASRVDLFASAEAEGMQQCLHTLDKICDALQHNSRTQRQLLAGETERASMPAAKVACRSSEASAKLKPSGSGTRHGSNLIRHTSAVQVSLQPSSTVVMPTGSGIHTAPPSSQQPQPKKLLMPSLPQGHKWQLSCH